MDIATMDGKEECADGPCRLDETYRILMESDGIIEKHRALRREMCLSRVVALILLLTCMAFCVLLFVQQAPGRKDNKENDEAKENGTLPFRAEARTDVEQAGAQGPLLASLRIATDCLTSPAKENLQWMSKILLGGFNLTESGEALIIPQDGWYRTSLQITYKEASPQEGQIDLKHCLLVYSDAYPEPRTFLSVFETVYKKGTWYKSVSSVGSYRLQKGDRLKVKTENASLVDCDGDVWTKTFFTVQLVARIVN